MSLAVTTYLDGRSPAVFKCTVTKPTVRLAGHDLGVGHLVRAATNKARTYTATMFGAETLANRGGGAVRHGARLLPASAMVFAIRFFSRCQTSGAACKLALSIRTMFNAETACFSNSGASFHLAHFRFATSMYVTPSL